MSAKARVPVWASAPRTDGTVEEVQVGYAVPSRSGFVLHLSALRIGTSAVASARAPAQAAPAAVAPPGAHAAVSTSIDELEQLASRCERVLADPKKARWHESERNLLSEILAEMDRKRPERKASALP